MVPRVPQDRPLHGRATDTNFLCVVTTVHDGDTLRCDDGTKVRLSAVAARELDETCSPGHPCPDASGAAAKKALQDLALGQRLQCEAAGTSYGRVTAWCWRDDEIQVNCELIQRGYALLWEKYDPYNMLCRAPGADRT